MGNKDRNIQVMGIVNLTDDSFSPVASTYARTEPSTSELFRGRIVAISESGSEHSRSAPARPGLGFESICEEEEKLRRLSRH